MLQCQNTLDFVSGLHLIRTLDPCIDTHVPQHDDFRQEPVDADGE